MPVLPKVPSASCPCLGSLPLSSHHSAPKPGCAALRRDRFQALFSQLASARLVTPVLYPCQTVILLWCVMIINRVDQQIGLLAPPLSLFGHL